jgi:hypothetical protein
LEPRLEPRGVPSNVPNPNHLHPERTHHDSHFRIGGCTCKKSR